MAMPKARNLGGRPRERTPKPGERVHLGLRVSPKLKRQLERAAAESTRSLSQEVELRLEESVNLRRETAQLKMLVRLIVQQARGDAIEFKKWVDEQIADGSLFLTDFLPEDQGGKK